MSDLQTEQGATRTRTVTWEDPTSVGPQTIALSGLDIMQRIRDGALPPPPMARLIGFECVVAETGEIVMEISPDGSVENGLGIAHGGMVATMLDTAMGAAANTVLPAGKVSVTLDLTITYLAAVKRGSAPIRATGKVTNVGRRTIYVVGEVRARADKLVAHAVGNFSIIDIPAG